ncbi:MAG: hypothetical protein Q8K26_01125 [Candidatus Gracilibacteria bacterium]|nr:hypothetical protein [Candidatus Gracilibacteria bacterium]
MDCQETGIIDLMADLMHLAHDENLDGFDLSRIAQKHFLVELATGSKPEAR